MVEDDKFYLEFENTYRGKREDIKDRLKTYLPFITPLFQVYPDSLTIDLGCGRGEWLELLQEYDISGIGVDSNKLMVDLCQGLDLKAVYGDALSFLKTQEKESVAMVSGFHIVEHLPFNILQELIKEIFRVLKPGGLLIFETPNTENIKVGTVNFYFDPTHLNPIPSQLLSFIVEYEGFFRVKILRLQEPEGIQNKSEINLSDVFSGVSPDYAIVAQKYGDSEVAALIDDPFNKEYGVDLDKLIHEYDMGLVVSQQEFMKKIDNVNAGIVSLNEKIEVFTSENELLKRERDELKNTLDQIYTSRSWKLTAPLRAIVGKARIWKSQLGKSKTRGNDSTSKNESLSIMPSQPEIKNNHEISNNTDFNLDEIMEKIREEVRRNGNKNSEYLGIKNGKIKESVAFRFIKKVQTFLRKLPFFTQINNFAVKFKRYIPKYKKQSLTVEDLIKFDGEEFIKTSYRTLLVREPDVDGFNNYLTELQEGKLSKIQILGRLRFSKEGRQSKVRVKGLFYKFLIGSIFKN